MVATHVSLAVSPTAKGPVTRVSPSGLPRVTVRAKVDDRSWGTVTAHSSMKSTRRTLSTGAGPRFVTCTW